MAHRIKMRDQYTNRVNASASHGEGVGVAGWWKVVCRDANGEVRWIDHFKNLVTDSGATYLMNIIANSATIKTPWYVGLIETTPTIASGDTMSSHAGWVEVTAYSAATRPVWVGAAAVDGRTSNTASTADFNINASTAAGGAFIAEDSSKTSTTGIIYAAGTFASGDRTGLQNGDTLQVSADFTAADDGA